MPVKLSVNVNKVATLRNSRGGEEPGGHRRRASRDSRQALPASPCIRALTSVTSRPETSARSPPEIETLGGAVEFNIEGDPRPDLIALVHDGPSDAVHARTGRPRRDHESGRVAARYPRGPLRSTVAALRAAGVRVSLFVDALPDAVRWAADTGADRIEIYTEPFAKAFSSGDASARRRAYAACVDAAVLAHRLGLGVNAGHDLNLENLVEFRELPHLAEVSIGHALISHALFVGLDRAVRDYLGAVAGTPSPPMSRRE